MKKLTAIIIIVCMAALLLVGCGSAQTTPINIAALQGPTGMGMVTLMGEEFASKYNISIESAPECRDGKTLSTASWTSRQCRSTSPPCCITRRRATS